MLLRFAQQENKTGLAVKLGLIAIAAIGVIYFTLLRGSSEENKQLDTPESAATYICYDDGNTFQLTPAQWSEPGRTQQVGGDPESGLRAGTRLMVKCPKCNNYAAILAIECPGGKFIPSVTKDNQLGQCPE